MVTRGNSSVSLASRAGLLGLDARHNKVKSIVHALRLLCRLLQGFLLYAHSLAEFRALGGMMSATV
jgi:hypothetical protein